MKPLSLVLAGTLWVASAGAQPPTIQSTPLPPLQQQWQQEGSPPVPQAPVSPDGQDQGAQAQQAPQNSPSAPPATTERPNDWLPATAAKIQALDKVNAQATTLTIKVGDSATFGSLTITAKACDVRPSDQPADAAAYLTVTNRHPDSPGFDGWMLAAEPSVSMMQDPIYDLRVTGCA